MDEPEQIVEVSGFDPEGEPEIRVMADGSMWVILQFLPPTWAELEPERFDNFDSQLAEATGVPVHWEDREFFRIDRPVPDTIDRVKSFLECYLK